MKITRHNWMSAIRLSHHDTIGLVQTCVFVDTGQNASIRTYVVQFRRDSPVWAYVDRRTSNYSHSDQTVSMWSTHDLPRGMAEPLIARARMETND